ncbi:MAG: hypothetical protein ACLP05_00210 [Candidatus Kryptoniota bacterium]
MTQTIRVAFGIYEQLPTDSEGFDFVFHFTTVSVKYVGAPEESKMTRHHEVIVGVTGSLDGAWQLQHDQLVKTLFEFGRQHVLGKLKDGTLGEREELQLSSANTPPRPPFDTSRIPDPDGVEFIVRFEEDPLAGKLEMSQIGSEIVDALDNINTIFHGVHDDLLFVPREFRAALELVKPVNSKDEYIVRTISLAQLVDQLNSAVLRKIVGETDSHVRSISLLERYMISLGSNPELVVKTLENILRVRQGFPAHAETTDGVREAHQYFGIGYPVTDFKDARRNLLSAFLKALMEIEKVVQKETKSKTSG